MIAIFMSRSCDFSPDPALKYPVWIIRACALASFIMQMESSKTSSPVQESSQITKIKTACEYQALKTCLENNNWRKEKCEKEWQEFENLCSRNRK